MENAQLTTQLETAQKAVYSAQAAQEAIGAELKAAQARSEQLSQELQAAEAARDEAQGRVNDFEQVLSLNYLARFVHVCTVNKGGSNKCLLCLTRQPMHRICPGLQRQHSIL